VIEIAIKYSLPVSMSRRTVLPSLNYFQKFSGMDGRLVATPKQELCQNVKETLTSIQMNSRCG
jgi:hypothetical protein